TIYYDEAEKPGEDHELCEWSLQLHEAEIAKSGPSIQFTYLRPKQSKNFGNTRDIAQKPKSGWSARAPPLRY
ncbi:MAG: hypothetical protein AAF362_14780, partial [Pseudomonadota bacterium]